MNPRARCILALDQGTTSSRAVLFDLEGRVIGIAQEEQPQLYPEAGWVEHSPEALWGTQRSTARRVLEQCGVRADEIAAVGIANQRETTLLWDRATGRPLHNAIVWQDRRTAPPCEQLQADGLEPLFREKTGLLLDPYFSGTKLRWLLDNVPGARRQATAGELAFGTVDTFLLWRLTGGSVHATDVSNASRTLLFNLHALDWDDELLRMLDIPREVLPGVLPSAARFGECRPDFLGASVPITGVAGDQQAATFAQACFAPGMVKNTYGTGSFLLMNIGDTPRESGHRLLTTVAWQIRDSEPRRHEDTKGSRRECEAVLGWDGRAARGGPHSPTPAPEYARGAASAGNRGLVPPSGGQGVSGPTTTYALEGSVFACGAAVQWLRDELGIIRTAAETEALAASVDNNGGVFMVPAFAGLGAPYWQSAARGAIVGLTRGAGRAHLARAALEAACYQSRDVIEAMEADCGEPLRALRVDGGMAANDLMLQFQADLLGIPVERPAVTETTALGAATLAGLAAGVYRDSEEIARLWRTGRTFEPRMSSDERDSLYAGWKRAVRSVMANAE